MLKIIPFLLCSTMAVASSQNENIRDGIEYNLGLYVDNEVSNTKCTYELTFFNNNQLVDYDNNRYVNFNLTLFVNDIEIYSKGYNIDQSMYENTIIQMNQVIDFNCK